MAFFPGELGDVVLRDPVGFCNLPRLGGPGRLGAGGNLEGAGADVHLDVGWGDGFAAQGQAPVLGVALQDDDEAAGERELKPAVVDGLELGAHVGGEGVEAGGAGAAWH